MATDDEAARKARAEALRKRIAQVRRPGDAGGLPPAAESPNEFVERRMREEQRRETPDGADDTKPPR